jgi:predicted nucleotidyltransferase component of viral defense system
LMAKTLERRVRAEVMRAGVPREVIEKDYAIGYVLAGMYGLPALGRRLVFKGGTALRKAHFPDYRFSEDLDFTALPGSDDLEPLIKEAAARAEKALQEQGDFGVSVTRYPTREPHPDGQHAFRIHVQFPWQRRMSCSLKVEISMDEPVLAEVVQLPLLHGYGETLDCTMGCYALEEVVAEKLRALLQTRARLAERGWARPRARDFYDLWQLLCARPEAVDVDGAARIVPAKCEVRRVSFAGPDDFFDESVLQRARLDWREGLRRMVADPPEFEVCLLDLRPPVSALVKRALSPAG